MEADGIFAGLNDEQRRAVETVRGPVCILAGAGSGKTTTITRRIANQVATGAFPAGAILAVTFTDKAAGEMRARLAALGADGVAARTFHSAALGQLRHFAPERVGKILPTKALMLRNIATSLPRPYRFRPAGDLATEIEWAKNRRIVPERYAGALAEHEPPIPERLMVDVYRRYERVKSERGLIDFEDLLELAIQTYDEDPRAAESFRERYRAFTVDEYQDVNLLQQTLLERWLGDRDELCAVGDDYQAIYAFTGATPDYLLSMPERFPGAVVVRLESNYRSSPQVLALANELVPKLGGAAKTLRAVLPEGPAPVTGPEPTALEEAARVVERARSLHEQDGLPYEELALLVRTNSRTADFEEAFSAAGIPFQGSSFLAREAARTLVRRLDHSASRDVGGEVRRLAESQGLVEPIPDGLGERELTRQNDLARIVRLAESFDDGSVTLADFRAELERRFDPRAEGSGINLLTYHRAKGLEFEAVFLPRLEERELPCRQAKSREAIAEERRLLYVGMTRAKRHLFLSWIATAKPSRFLAELGLAVRRERPPRPRDEELPPAFGALKAWRLERAKTDGVPAYVVFHDSTLVEIAERSPRSRGELASVAGVGPAKLDRYAEEVLATLATTA